MTSSDNISQIFYDESQKLQNLISTMDSKINLNIAEIIETYYQIMNVSSMINMFKEQSDHESKSMLDKISVTEKLISEQFNSCIHPKIMGELSISIQDTTKKLQSGNVGEKSKEEIESEAKLFEELRQKMSTKEFVEQYDKGLHHD